MSKTRDPFYYSPETRISIQKNVLYIMHKNNTPITQCTYEVIRQKKLLEAKNTESRIRSENVMHSLYNPMKEYSYDTFWSSNYARSSFTGSSFLWCYRFELCPERTKAVSSSFGCSLDESLLPPNVENMTYLLFFLNSFRHHVSTGRCIVQFALQIIAIRFALGCQTLAHFFDMIVLNKDQMEILNWWARK